MQIIEECMQVPVLTTLSKGLQILTLFGENGSELSIPQIADKSNLAINATYRYIATLKAEGWIEQAQSPGFYRLAAKVLTLVHGIRYLPVIDAALPLMGVLSEETLETVHLAGVQGLRGVCLEKIEGKHVLRVSYDRGTTFFLHAGATGRSLMAYLAKDIQDIIIKKVGLPKLGKNTITDSTLLRSSLREIRERGYAASEEEVHEGAAAIAAPVFDDRGSIIANLSIAGPTVRFRGASRRRSIPLLVGAAREITGKLSHSEELRNGSSTHKSSHIEIQ